MDLGRRWTEGEICDFRVFQRETWKKRRREIRKEGRGEGRGQKNRDGGLLEKLAHGIMQAEKSHNKPSISWGP